MSVIVPKNLVKADLASKIETELTVVGTASNPKAKFDENLRIHSWNIFKENGKELVCLPFAYYYQHCSSLIKREMLDKHEQKKFGFQGNLLPRQAEIKDQVLEILSRTGSVLLSLHTGFGKTIFTLYLCSRMGLKTIVLCHRDIIMQQWMEAISKYLPNCKSLLLAPTDYKKSPDTYFDEADIVITNVLNVPKIDKKHLKVFGCAVIDEVHTICTQQFSKALFALVPSYMIGLSATPYREDGMDKLLELYLGPETVVRNLKRSFNAYRLNTQFKPDMTKTLDDSICWNSALSSQADDPNRNSLICKLVWFFGHRNILVLVKRKDHAKKLKKVLTALGEDVDCFMHTDKFVNYSCRVLIATYSKGGVGFDHPKLDMLITGGDVKAYFMQYLGRIFRRDDTLPIYVDLRDNNGIMLQHSKERLRVCEEVGGNITDFPKAFPHFEQYTQHLNVLEKQF